MRNSLQRTADGGKISSIATKSPERGIQIPAARQGCRVNRIESQKIGASEKKEFAIKTEITKKASDAMRQIEVQGEKKDVRNRWGYPMTRVIERVSSVSVDLRKDERKNACASEEGYRLALLFLRLMAEGTIKAER